MNFSYHPFSDFVAVTKANADLPKGPCRGFYVGTAGTISLMDRSGNIVENLTLGEGHHPFSVRQFRAGGTADNIIAFY